MIFGKLDPVRTDVLLVLRALAQHFADGSDSELDKTSVVCTKVHRKANGRGFQVADGAVRGPDKQRRLDSLCNMPSFFVSDATVYCLLRSLFFLSSLTLDRFNAELASMPPFFVPM